MKNQRKSTGPTIAAGKSGARSQKGRAPPSLYKPWSHLRHEQGRLQESRWGQRKRCESWAADYFKERSSATWVRSRLTLCLKRNQKTQHLWEKHNKSSSLEFIQHLIHDVWDAIQNYSMYKNKQKNTFLLKNG